MSVLERGDYWLNLMEEAAKHDPDWRDYPARFLSAKGEVGPTEGNLGSLRADLVLEFLKDGYSDWLSEIAPYCVRSQMEWVMQSMDAAEIDGLPPHVYETARAIWSYLQEQIHQWLLEKIEHYEEWME